MKQFTDHGYVLDEKIESSDPSTRQTSAMDGGLAEAAKLQSVQEYHLKYLGNTESDPPKSPSPTQFIDSTLIKLKVEYSKQQRQAHKAGKTSTASLDLMAFASASPTLGRHTKSSVSVISEESHEQLQAAPLHLAIRKRKGDNEQKDSKDVAIKIIRATPEPNLVLNEGSTEILKVKSAPQLTRSSVPEQQPASGEDKEAINLGQLGGQGGNGPEQALQEETVQEIEKEKRFSLGPQVLATKNQSETRLESKERPEPSQDSQISHSRQSSQYETAEVTLEIADKHEEEEAGTEDGAWDPAVLPRTSRRRSLTVLTESGIIVSQSPELASSEKTADGTDPRLQSPESVQDSESSQSVGSQSERSSTSTSTHSLERVKSFERIKTNKSFVAAGSEEEGGDTEYDVLSDLDNLRSTPEFQALGRLSDLPNQKVKLVFSGLCVSVFLEQSGEQLLKRTIRTIACSAQVSQRVNREMIVCMNFVIGINWGFS